MDIEQLLDLQEKFEVGKISEEELSDEQIILLNKLYRNQIKHLDFKIEKKQIEVKKKILLANESYRRAIKGKKLDKK